jgi:aryl-alcohol dehydrogenase-like predicted oxidoreductase
MKYRTLGRTGIRVSEVGFGGWAIGNYQWGKQKDKDSAGALEKALSLGCNFFDTALAYGQGHSEMIIGKTLKKHKLLDDVIIATKAPPKNWLWSPPAGEPIKEAFPPEWIRECCETSLKNMDRSYIDLLQLHTWSRSWDRESAWYEALLDLKEEGKIRAFGISVRGAQPDEANAHIENGRVDTIQTVYNILDQKPVAKLFPAAAKNKVGIIAREPLAGGGLTGKFTKDTKFEKGDWRGESRGGRRRYALEKVIAQVDQVKQIIGKGVKPYEAAIRFCLSDPAVSVVIAGIRNEKQATMNLRAGRATLPKDKVAKLKGLWKSGKIGGLTFP